MSQGDAHACGVAGLQGRKPATDVVIPGLGESLDVPKSGFVAGIGMKSGYGKRVSQPVDGPGEQGHCLLRQRKNGLVSVATAHRILEGGRKVDKQAHCNIPSGMTKILVDARVDGSTTPVIDPGTQGPVEVEFGPVFLAAQALAVLRLDLIEDACQAVREHRVFL